MSLIKILVLSELYLQKAIPKIKKKYELFIMMSLVIAYLLLVLKILKHIMWVVLRNQLIKKKYYMI